MFGGQVSRLAEGELASAASISPKSDLVILTDTTSIATIVPPQNGGFSGFVIIVPTGGAVATLTTGNIAVAVTMPDKRATLLVYSKSEDKWYPGAIS